ncbi:GFA family protein [Brevundimonas sp.]|uniref:GFA family protein n=1 Tax=Brevundimonas sp. TaxID=1871086 RepID=UPI002D68CED0|nr:GFA family protein [Brevundimonas sp.]HYC74791.1 GFA family protein [Brevundimonas sp.]
MSRSWTGGCACGAVRYETPAEPVFQNHCQCRDCQKRSGAGHGSWLTFPRRAEMAIAGEASVWRVMADNGNEKAHGFCPTCGTPVHLTFSFMPDMIAVPAASLDDPGRFNPQAVTYSVRRHSWDRLDPALQTFDRMPG